jgi:hypothetical protein
MHPIKLGLVTKICFSHATSIGKPVWVKFPYLHYLLLAYQEKNSGELAGGSDVVI